MVESKIKEISKLFKRGKQNKPPSEWEKYEVYAIFSDTELKEISWTIIPDSKELPNEKFLLSYIKNEKLDFKLYAIA